MSHHTTARRITPSALRQMKGGTPIVCLTAYTAPMAALLDDHVDILLVGDSLGMVLYGMESTLSVTMDMMIRHTHAVARHSHKACVVADMPFGSYQASPTQAFVNAAQLMAEGGAQAVKLEGGMEMVETVHFLCERGVPVMAHVGLKPQHVNQMGGYKVQGREKGEGESILKEARALQDAGAFCVLIEGTAEPVAAEITRKLTVPTIGIGASPACDGQVLVTEDMIGLLEQPPRCVRQFSNVRESITQAVSGYSEAVRTRHFPGAEHCYGIKKS
jgi:3-methyl-2-oxobutanoate hydroxymethyltransferase